MLHFYCFNSISATSFSFLFNEAYLATLSSQFSYICDCLILHLQLFNVHIYIHTYILEPYGQGKSSGFTECTLIVK
jgi:hypothetical protein